MGEVTAKKDRALSGWDIRYLVPFWPEPEPEPDLKNGRISGQPEPEMDIQYIPIQNTVHVIEMIFIYVKHILLNPS